MTDIKLGAVNNVMVFLTDSTDHVSGATGKTLTIYASKNGGTFASITPTVTERGYGWYNVALSAVHCNTLGELALHIEASGADPADAKYNVGYGNFTSLELFGIASIGTAQAASTASITLESTETAEADAIIGSVIYITSASTGAKQSAVITDYNATTKAATISPTLPVTPTGTVQYVIYASPAAPTDSAVIPNVAVQSVASNAITAAAIASDAGTEIGTAVWANGTRTLTANPGLDSTAVQAAAAAALNAYDPPTNAEMVARTLASASYATAGSISALNNLSSAQAQSAAAAALTAYDPPTKAELDSAVAPLATASALSTLSGYIDTEITEIKSVTDKIDTTLQLDGAAYQFTSAALENAPTGGGGGGATDWNADERAAIRKILGIPETGNVPVAPTEGALDAIRDDVASVAGNVTSIMQDTGTDIPSLIAALNDVSFADIMTTQLTESYAANGTVPTVAQALLAIHQRLMDFSIAGTSRTVRRFDGSTAFTSAFDDATNPTGESR